MREIFFCENNVSRGLEDMIEKLEQEFPDVVITEEICLGHCNDCAEKFIAVIDDDMIEGKTSEELFENIRERLIPKNE